MGLETLTGKDVRSGMIDASGLCTSGVLAGSVASVEMEGSSRDPIISDGGVDPSPLVPGGSVE